jgi:hypothetical protein
MSKTTDKPFPSGLVSKDAQQLVLEINDLVRVRTALSYGSATGAKQSAESAISRKINSKVIELSKLVSKECEE